MTDTPSAVVFTGNGSQTDFVFPFTYLKPDHVKVSVGGIAASFTLINQTTVRVSPAPAGGTIVRVYRDTPGDPLVEWNDGAVMLGKDLNLATGQAVNVAQEARDAAEESAAIAQSANDFAADAAASADAAAIAAANASNASAIHAADAEAAKIAAEKAATNANLSAASASGSATIATTKANEAHLSANRAENAALLLEGGSHMHNQSDIVNLVDDLAGKAPAVHTHDDRYYTEAEVDTLLNGKAASSHTHDDRYYTEAEVNSLLAAKAAVNNPSFTGAMTGTHTLQWGYPVTTSADWNTFTTSGFYLVNNAINSPDGTDAHFFLLVSGEASSTSQMAWSLFSTPRAYIRKRHYGYWGVWTEVLTGHHFGTTAEVRAGTATAKIITPSNAWGAAAYVTLTQEATIAVDFSLGFNFTTVMTGNRILGAPTNLKAGQSGVIQLVQDATGSRTLAYNAIWRFANNETPVLSTAANARDLLSYVVLPDNTIFAALAKAVP